MKKRKWFQRLLVLLLIVSMAAPVNTAVYAAELTDEAAPVQDESMDSDTDTDERKPDETNDAADDVDIEHNTDPSDIDPDDADKTGNPSDTDSVQPIDPDKTTSESKNPDADNDTENKNEDLDISDETVTVEETEEAVAPMSLYASANEEPVAKVGETPYSSIQSAIEAAGSGATIEILAPIDGNVEIGEDKNITLNLNGQTINGTVINKGTLTIEDSSEGKAGKIVGQTENTGTPSGTAACLTEAVKPHAVVNYGTLTIKNGTFDVTKTGTAALFNGIDGKATIEGGTFTRSCEDENNTSESGGNNSWYTVKNYGEMEIKDGNFTLNGHFSSMVANGWQNGTQNTEERPAKLVIRGGTFSGGINTIKNDDWGNLTIEGGTFENVSQHAVMNWNTAVINGGTFSSDADAAIYNGYDDDKMDKGELTINGGSVTSKASNAVYNAANASMTITDGNFTSPENYYVTYTATAGKASITGGSFSSQYVSNRSADEYYPGHAPEQNSDGTYSLTALTAENAVASVTSNGETTYYSTFAGALAGAEAGDTVTLLKDTVIDSVIIRKAVTLDLGGRTLSIKSDASGWYGLALLADVTLKNGEIIDLRESVGNVAVQVQDSNLTTNDLKIQTYRSTDTAGYTYPLRIMSTSSEKHVNATLGSGTVITDADIPGKTAGYETYGAVGVTVLTTDGTDSYQEGTSKASLTVESGAKIDTTGFAVSGNGTCHNTLITIKEGAELISDSTAIYHPQGGTLNIEGGSITGKTGIEIRAGILNMTGGTVTGTGSPTTVNPNGNGTTSDGAGIAIAQHTTKLPIEVNISGGEISGYSALYESNPQSNSADDIAKVGISISAGKFTAINNGTNALHSEDVKNFVSGGAFSSRVEDDYCAEGYKPTNQVLINNTYYTVQIEDNNKAVAQIGELYYDSVEAAIQAVQSGAEGNIVLLRDQTESVTIPKGVAVTLDLNGNTLTAEEEIEVLGDLTIKDTKDEGKVTCSNSGGGAIVVSGTVTLESGTIENNTGYGIYAINGGTAIVKSGGIDSKYAALAGNNTDGNMNFTVNGGTLTAEQGPAIYMPGQGNLTITDGTLNGGISLRMGQVNISGGTINAIKTDIDSPAEYYNYSGNAWLPDALYVFGGTYTSDDSQYGNSLSLNITGGTFNCENEQGSAVAIYDLGKTEQKEEIKISGNAVLKTNAKDRQAYQVLSLEDIGVTNPANGYGSETLVGKVNTAISAGSFSTAVSPEYCANGFVPSGVLKDGMYTVTKPTAAAPTNNTNNTSSSGSKKHHKSSKDSDSEESAAAAVSAAQSVTSARTGDSTNIWFPVLLLLAALAGAGSCGYMAVFRKKRK